MNKWKKLRKQSLGQVPTEASLNLTAPETAPLRKNVKANIRTKPLNFKVSEDFYWQLKELALKEKHLMVEIIEKSLECYKQHYSKVNSSSDKEQERKIKKAKKPFQKQLNPHSHQDFICNSCRREFYDETAYSPRHSSGFLEQTYCTNCVKITREAKI